MEHDWAVAPPGVAGLAARAGPERVATAAAFHGVTGCVHHSLAPVVDPERFVSLVDGYRQDVDRHVRALGDLSVLAPALDGLGVRWLVVKGPVLAELHYTRPDRRSYTDLDVLVPSGDVGPVLEAVEAAGGHLLDRNWRLLRELEVGELLVRLRHGTLLDLHWHLFNDVAVRRTVAASTGDLLDRSRQVRLAGTPVATLDPTDTLVHLGAHATLSGGHRLVWLKDLDRFIASEAPDWEAVVVRARAWGVGPAVGLAVDRARRILGVRVPAGVPEALAGGRAVLAAGAAADALSPPARSSGRRSVGRIVSRSARADAGATVAEFGRRARAALVSRDRFSLDPPATDMDPANPRSPRHDAGPEERRAFLGAIASET